MSLRTNPASVVEDVTSLEPVQFTLKWSIQHFEGLQNESSFLYSTGTTMSELGMDDSYRGRWRIGVRPCYSFTENNVEVNYVSVFLSLTDEDVTSTSYTGERSLSCIYKRRVTTGKLINVDVDIPIMLFTPLLAFSSEDNNRGTIRLISHQDLLGFGDQEGCLKDSCFDIAIDVILYKEPKISRIPEAVSLGLLQRYQEFLGRQLQQQEAGGDFVLVSSDGKEFHVDRSFLMAQSPVFAAMLTHPTKEKQESRCQLQDVDAESVEILLEYVCGCSTGKIQGDNAEKVLIMADKYRMMDLRAVCERTMANYITVKNAVQVSLLARQRNLPVLKNAAIHFMRKNMDLEIILDEYFNI